MCKPYIRLLHCPNLRALIHNTILLSLKLVMTLFLLNVTIKLRPQIFGIEVILEWRPDICKTSHRVRSIILLSVTLTANLMTLYPTISKLLVGTYNIFRFTSL